MLWFRQYVLAEGTVDVQTSQAVGSLLQSLPERLDKGDKPGAIATAEILSKIVSRQQNRTASPNPLACAEVNSTKAEQKFEL